MTVQDLRTRLREHIEAAEPNPMDQPDLVLALGRRRLMRRRLATGVAAAVVLATASTATYAVIDRDPTGERAKQGLDPAVQEALAAYDAQRMPQLLAERTTDHLGDQALAGLGEPKFVASDGQFSPINRRADWDKASALSLDYRDGARSLHVGLLHARGEAEGDMRRLCAQSVKASEAFSCEVREVGGALATIKLNAISRADKWDLPGLVRPSELRNQRYGQGSPFVGRKFDLDDIWFARSVEVVKSDTFVAAVAEEVHTSDLETAKSLFKAEPDRMVALAADAELVIPKPPRDPVSGCDQWVKPNSGVTCPAE